MSEATRQQTLPTQERIADEPTADPDLDPHHVIDIRGDPVPVDPADCTDCQLMTDTLCWTHTELTEVPNR